MRSKVYTIGRSEECDIRIDDPTNITSGKHAVFKVVKAGRYTITDCSTNGTYVNGIKIEPNVEVPVMRKDAISFAHMVDFDWNLIPDDRKRNRMILISVTAGAILLCLIVLAAAKYMGRPQSNPKTSGFGNQTSLPAPTKDSLAVKDSLSKIFVSPDNEQSKDNELEKAGSKGKSRPVLKDKKSEEASADAEQQVDTTTKKTEKKVTNPLI